MTTWPATVIVRKNGFRDGKRFETSPRQAFSSSLQLDFCTVWFLLCQTFVQRKRACTLTSARDSNQLLDPVIVRSDIIICDWPRGVVIVFRLKLVRRKARCNASPEDTLSSSGPNTPPFNGFVPGPTVRIFALISEKVRCL